MSKTKAHKFKRAIAGLISGIVALPNLIQLSAFADETEKYQYNLFGRNGITVSADNFCVNGNWHTNKTAEVSFVNGNFNGYLTTKEDIDKRVKYVYADQKIYSTYFNENCEFYESDYSYSDMNININTPLFSCGNVTLNGNVALNSNLGTLMNLNITGEVKNANNSVVYSKYGNITIENTSTANINGLIYVPLGTLTINSPNVNLNGVIIADKVIINGNSVNINNNDNIARFVGTTSEQYDFSGLEYLPEDWLGDTDEDGLFDIYEKVIDSDPLDTDTDDDGLPDGYEVLRLNTDPLEVDTDENGVTDADEDFDSDNLSNLGEYQNKTNPFNSDTDDDGFLDGDEIFMYGTDPLNPDTDNDGLLDGEESYDGSIYTKYGIYFDPLNPDTNGNGILDGDEVFGQSKRQEVETHDEVITEVNVDMDTNGNLEKNLTITSMYNIDAMSTNVYAMIGEPFDFTSATDFESATITFKVDQSKLGNTLFDNLIILWYNEEDQTFEEMPTTRDAVNSTVSTTTTHFSQYMVVDSAKWYENWENSLNWLRTMWIGGTTYSRDIHTIFLIDCSQSMSVSDNISYSIEIGYNGVTEENYSAIISDMDSLSDVNYYLHNYGRRHCYRTSIPENVINNKGSDDLIKIITFSNSVEEDSGFSSYYSWLKKYIQKVNNDGNQANLDSAVSQAFNNVVLDSVDKYRFIVLTDNNVNVSDNVLNHNWNNSDLIFVNLGDTPFRNQIDYLANETGGTTYDAISASDLTYESGGLIYTPEQFIGKDSDGDGIPDIVELYGLKPNGELIGTDPYNIDSDGDTIPDNIELQYAGNQLSSGMNVEQYVTSLHCSSDPNNPDTDYDGLNDNVDPSPYSPFDKRFYISDNYQNTVPESDFVKRAWQEGEDCYGTVEPEADDWIASVTLLSTMALADGIAYLPLPTSGLWSALQDEDNTWTWANLDNAADMLYYYLTNSTSELILPEDDVKDVISCHDNNMLHLKYNINQLMSAAEQTTYNNTNTICTTSDSAMRVVCMVDREVECELRGVEVNGVTHPDTMMELNTGKQADWNLALGSCYGGMVAEVTSNGNNYSMRYKYYILDVYEWAAHAPDSETLSQIMHRLHEIGLAHQYLITGCYEGTIEWTKGDTTASEYVMNQIESDLGI